MSWKNIFSNHKSQLQFYIILSHDLNLSFICSHATVYLLCFHFEFSFLDVFPIVVLFNSKLLLIYIFSLQLGLIFITDNKKPKIAKAIIPALLIGYILNK